jgi:enoyl-CoA hydratase
MGLVNAVVPGDELIETALGLARRITANAPLAVQATKASALAGLYVDDHIVHTSKRALRSMLDALSALADSMPADAASEARLAIADAEQAVKELRSAFQQESAYSNAVFRSDDAKEGPKAFAEKRPPVWKGR